MIIFQIFHWFSLYFRDFIWIFVILGLVQCGQKVKGPKHHRGTSKHQKKHHFGNQITPWPAHSSVLELRKNQFLKKINVLKTFLEIETTHYLEGLYLKLNNETYAKVPNL